MSGPPVVSAASPGTLNWCGSCQMSSWPPGEFRRAACRMSLCCEPATWHSTSRCASVNAPPEPLHVPSPRSWAKATSWLYRKSDRTRGRAACRRDRGRAMENDSRARAYVIGGELVVLKRAADVCVPCLPWQKRANWDEQGKSSSSACWKARRDLLSDWPPRSGSTQDARRIRGDRPALDRRAWSGRSRSPAAARRRQGAPQLARASSLLFELRRRHQHR